MVQTNLIKDMLEKISGTTVEFVTVVTTGDQIQDRSLAEIGGKGLFVKGLEDALIQNKADIAMHSLKDVPPSLEDGFCISAVIARHSPCDVLVSNKYKSIEELPLGAIIGTSSVRRKAATLNMRPDLNIKMIRGNVDTRLSKLDSGEVDALILAEAGLNRLGLDDRIAQVFSLESFVPSVGQGVIAIECLSVRRDIIEILKHLNDPATFSRITAERAMNNALKASCTSPIGSFAEIKNNELCLHGTVWSLDGKYKIETLQVGKIEDAEKIGQQAALDLESKGARALLDSGVSS